MMPDLKTHLLGPLALALTGCFAGHTAEVKQHALPPLPDPIIRHSGRVYIHLPDEATPGSQCVAYEGYQTLCFEGVRAALEQSLSSLLWPSFPEVKLRRHGDELRPGDYLLQVDLSLDALPPDASRHGWSAGAKGRWRVLRGGSPVRGETLATRSRGHFAYGSGLGQAAGEVVDAIAAHIAEVMVRLPERDTVPPVLLPPVIANDSIDASGNGVSTEPPPDSVSSTQQHKAKSLSPTDPEEPSKSTE